jgi:hypothetical protein
MSHAARTAANKANIPKPFPSFPALFPGTAAGAVEALELGPVADDSTRVLVSVVCPVDEVAPVVGELPWTPLLDADTPDVEFAEWLGALLVDPTGGGADDAAKDGGDRAGSLDAGALGAAEEGGGGACSLEAGGLGAPAEDGPGPG